MSDDFSTPSETPKGDYFAPADFLGKLILFSPTKYAEEVATDYGVKDQVHTHVVVLDAVDDDGNLPEFDDAWIRAGSLIAVLKTYAKKGSGRVLGRMGRGTAKPGMQAPYVLKEPTEADKQMARDWINGKPKDPFAI